MMEGGASLIVAGPKPFQNANIPSFFTSRAACNHPKDSIRALPIVGAHAHYSCSYRADLTTADRTPVQGAPPIEIGNARMQSPPGEQDLIDFDLSRTVSN